MTTRSSGPLVELALDLAWRQWSSLGVAGDVRQGGNAIIDPEALIIFTGEIGGRDPRLRDEALDWCIAFGASIVSVSRMKNIRAMFTGEAADRFLASVNNASSARWPVAKNAVPWAVARSGKSRLPRAEKEPALSRLQLRALFGVTARAEILLALLTDHANRNRFVSAAELQFVGYSKRNVALVLEELERASLLQRRSVGNQVRYRLAKAHQLEQLAPCVATAVLVRWDLILAALARALEVFDHAAGARSAVASVEASKLVTSLRPTWDALGLQPPAPVRGREHEYHGEVVDWLANSLVPTNWR